MFLLIIFCLKIFYAQSLVEIPLKNYQWQVKNVETNPSEEFQVPVNIPNGIYSALHDNGILPQDILYRFNDVEYRWVANKTWKYSVRFSVDESVLSIRNPKLIFHGLDGIATIFFNNLNIGNAQNTFVRYQFDITTWLKKDNTLEIIFDPPISSALTSTTKSKHNIPDYYPSSKNGEKYVNFLRRMQASFGTNFGPAFPSVGVWKEVELVAYQNDVIVRDIIISTVPEEDKWNVQITIYYETALYVIESKMKRTINAVFTLENNKLVEFSKEHVLEYSDMEEGIVIHGSISKADVKEWWPNGYGEQNLYDLTVSFSHGISRSTKSIRVGFRTIDLVQDHIDSVNPEKRLLFYFAVNKVPIFAKGANFLPANILLEKASDEKTIEYLLRSSKVANMNMLRVSAAGIYQSNYFYELCDEYGILIWQDMMFHVHMYPTDPKFLLSVSKEINQQISRLQYHPSIALWVGNSETENGIKLKWKNTRNRKEYLKEYEKLTKDTIQNIIAKLDGTRPYLKSTPSNGLKSNDDDNPSADFQYGDSHSFLDIGIDSWITDNYFTPRFASEYGLQSFPSFHILEKVAINGDLLSLDTPFMKHRQHALYEDGNKKIEQSFSHHFGGSSNSLTDIIYASQIDQAWSVKLQTEWYRNWRSKISKNESGRTMGALYWHLNDVWQAPTWSSIEYGGKWKMLHYYAKKFFAPVLVSADINKSGEVTINFISDLLVYKRVALKIEIFKWDSMIPVFKKIKSLSLANESSTKYQSTHIRNIFPENTCQTSKNASEKCFLKLTLLEDDSKIISDNYLFPSSSFKNIDGLQNPAIDTHVENCYAKKCTIEIVTDAIALFVWLDVEDISGYFSDNGFMMTEPKKIITFFSEDEVNVDDIRKYLSVKMMNKLFLENFSNQSRLKKSIFNVIL